ncbi:hypothetical protein MKZ38_000503 [Zalerion maritima]|uniref:Uncharacterized protein n=1 Tax=Zalerion maritima TaxID=339359 RepID=A0AAD5RZF4_9PEZI|nr:hypothetical protein MKZ38_000503 [Zalerion maritima]
MMELKQVGKAFRRRLGHGDGSRNPNPNSGQSNSTNKTSKKITNPRNRFSRKDGGRPRISAPFPYPFQNQASMAQATTTLPVRQPEGDWDVSHIDVGLDDQPVDSLEMFGYFLVMCFRGSRPVDGLFDDKDGGGGAGIGGDGGGDGDGGESRAEEGEGGGSVDGGKRREREPTQRTQTIRLRCSTKTASWHWVFEPDHHRSVEHIQTLRCLRPFSVKRFVENQTQVLRPAFEKWRKEEEKGRGIEWVFFVLRELQEKFFVHFSEVAKLENRLLWFSQGKVQKIWTELPSDKEEEVSKVDSGHCSTGICIPALETMTALGKVKAVFKRSEKTNTSGQPQTYTSGNSLGTPIVDHSASPGERCAFHISIQEIRKFTPPPPCTSGGSSDAVTTAAGDTNQSGGRFQVVFLDQRSRIVHRLRFTASGGLVVVPSAEEPNQVDIKDLGRISISHPGGLPVPSFLGWSNAWSQGSINQGIVKYQLEHTKDDSSGTADALVIAFMGLLVVNEFVDKEPWSDLKESMGIPKVQIWR